MNVQQIDYILAVAELRHFGRAAEQCNITQSTISTMVARFEEELGLLLFDRKQKPVVLTKEGEEVIRQLYVVRKELENLNEQVRSLKGEGRSELKIGIIPTIGPYLLPLFLNSFVNNYPDIRFEVSEVTTEEIVSNILSRDLDIGIVSIPLRNPAISEYFLYDEPFLCFDQDIKKESRNYRVSELDYDRLWLLGEGHCMRTQVEKICAFQQSRPLSRNLNYKSATINTLIKFVKNSKGVTLLPFLATLDLTLEEKETLYNFEAPVPCRSVGVIVHRHFTKRGLLESLQQHILECVSPRLPIVQKAYFPIDPV